ncbi:MAG: hypothetical protein JSV92_00920 [archaeon]|nr:MAG: hypothetical protein JSV92_00920 [archaeon]
MGIAELIKDHEKDLKFEAQNMPHLSDFLKDSDSYENAFTKLHEYISAFQEVLEAFDVNNIEKDDSKYSVDISFNPTVSRHFGREKFQKKYNLPIDKNLIVKISIGFDDDGIKDFEYCNYDESYDKKPEIFIMYHNGKKHTGAKVFPINEWDKAVIETLQLG